MSLDTTALTPANDPNCLDAAHADSKVYEVQTGTPTNKNDIDFNNQRLRNQTHTLNEIKADLAGDTFTGRVIVGAAAATNHNAIQATGNGTGAGITATGGATGNGAVIAAGGGNNNGTTSTGAGTGAGVRGVGGSTGIGGVFLAGGGNTAGVDASGAGTGSGITAVGGGTGTGGTFTAGGGNTAGLSSTGAGTGAGAALTGGSTGPGLTAVNGTAQTNTAPTCAIQAAGYIQLTGTDPSAGVDPGANNVIHGANIIKAWCTLDDSYAIRDSYNVDSVTTVLGDVKKLTFKRAMADNKYGVKIHVHGDVARSGSHNGLAQKLAGEFQFVLYDTTTGGTGLGAIADEIYIEVTGRQ